MTLIEKLKALWDRDRDKLTYVRFDPSHVDRKLNTQPIQAGKHYFRLRLAEMFLTKQVQAGKTWYPAVHSLVQLNFGNQQVQIPNIADTSRVGAKESAGGDVIARNFALTPAMPFNGGLVSLDAGLVAIQGENYLNNFIGVLSGFAGLLAVPQLSTVLGVAQPLVNGIQELLGAGNGRLHLALQESFSANDISEGYIAVIRAAEGQVDKSRLWVVQDQLREGMGMEDGRHKPFEQFDHLLFRFEVFEQRDDWAALTRIDEPFQEALKQLGDGNLERAQYFLVRAKLAAQQAPELTTAHRRIVSNEMSVRFEQAKADFGISGLVGDDLTLADIMKHPSLNPDEALDLGEPTSDEIFAGES